MVNKRYVHSLKLKVEAYTVASGGPETVQVALSEMQLIKAKQK